MIEQLRPKVLSILMLCHYMVTSQMGTVQDCPNLSEMFPKTFNHHCMASKLMSYHRWYHVSL